MISGPRSVGPSPHTHSVENSFDFWCEVYASDTSGYSWQEPVFAHGGDKQWMSVDRSGGIGDGNIYSHWTSYWGATGDDAFNRSTGMGQSFDYPAEMPGSPYWGTTTVGPDGTVYVAGVAQSGPLPVVVAWSTSAQDPNSPLALDGSSYLDLGGLPLSRESCPGTRLPGEPGMTMCGECCSAWRSFLHIVRPGTPIKRLSLGPDERTEPS